MRISYEVNRKDSIPERILMVPLTLAFCIATAEILWARFHAATGSGSAIPLWNEFLYAGCWFPLLLGARALGNVVAGTRSRLLKSAAGILVILMLFASFLLVSSSWYFYSRTGMFLSLHHLQFGLDNLAALQFHFLQTAPSLWIGLTTAALVLSVLAQVILFNWRPQKGRTVRILTWAGLIAMVSAGVGTSVMSSRSSFESTPSHPLISYLTPSGDVQLLEEGATVPMPPLQPHESGTLAVNRPVPTRPVIVLMMESLRWDLMNMEPSPIPFMHQLAQEGRLFTRAYAPASHSDYADLSIWYSRYPLWAERVPRYRKDDPFRSLSVFEVFKEMGYRTAYVSSQNEKWGGMIHWLKVPEVDYFFHSEDYTGNTWVNEDDRSGLSGLMRNGTATAGKIEDSQTLSVCREWIDSVTPQGPFFLGVNLQNTHFNYVLPPGAEEPYQPCELDFPTVYYAWPRDKATIVKNRYLNACYNLDRLTRDFVDDLKKRGIWDNCWFVIIGDSGEGFYEHDFANHSGPMYDEAIRTFCMIKPPVGEPAGRIDTPVNLIDILPTLLDMMGQPDPDDFQGISALSPTLSRPVYLHSNGIVTQDGIVDWPWKLLVTHSPGKRIELYNLETDPAESDNQYTLEARRASQMLRELAKWRKIQIQYTGNPDLYRNYYPPRYIRPLQNIPEDSSREPDQP